MCVASASVLVAVSRPMLCLQRNESTVGLLYEVTKALFMFGAWKGNLVATSVLVEEVDDHFFGKVAHCL